MKAALKILVVEDSLPQMAAILETVRMAGCEPSGVTSLREAQDALASASFGALLTDIHLTSTMEQDSYEAYFGQAFDNVINFISNNPTGLVNPEALKVLR